MSIAADYVVVGAGAMGMAFADEIVTQTDATVAMFDLHGRPGGHWNDAYPYVRLHQPSFFYGVNSAELGSNRKDEVGLNVGLSELATGTEVCAYFDQIMQRRLLPSGRVEYFPNTRYVDGEATILPSGRTMTVTADRAVVDATYMKVTVPSVRPPAYEVAPEVTVIPPNALPGTSLTGGGYVVVGAGKTAMDAVLWLLTNQVDPDAIRWVMPRDSWMINRAMTQPDDFGLSEQVSIIANAASRSELFLDLERAEQFFRLDPSIEPTMYRCATVTVAELEQMRRVRNVIRKGRVRRIGVDLIELDEGTVPSAADTVYIDCTADGLERRPVVPVFQPGRLTLQTVRSCQQVFSAAFIARVEALDETIDAKNELASVIPHPNTPGDFLSGSLAHIHALGRWSQHPAMASWLEESRLSPSIGGATRDLVTAIQAIENLERFLAED